MRLLRLINRPWSESDVLLGVKDAINDAILLIQRNQAFALSEALASITYSADALTVSLASVGGSAHQVRNVRSVQQVSASGTYQGKPLKVVSYDVLQSMRNRVDRTHSSDALAIWPIEDSYQSDKVAFIVGSAIGIYPTPTSAVYLYINYNYWLPRLVNDGETNFLLDYAGDVIELLAFKKMQTFMKDSSLYGPTREETEIALLALIQWDSQVRESFKYNNA